MMIKIIKQSKNILKTILIIGILAFVLQFSVLAKDPTDKKLSLILAVDSSGSMHKTDPNYLRKKAANLFVKLLSTGDQVGIIEFSSDVNVLSPLKTITSPEEKHKISNVLANLKTAGDTRIDLAVEEAIKQFDTSDFTNKAIILLSDGALDVDGSPFSEASKNAKDKLLSSTLDILKNKGIKVYSISLSDDSADLKSKNLQQEVLETLSDSTAGFYSVASSSVDLHKKFIDVLIQITDPPQLPYRLVNKKVQFHIDSKIKRVNIVIYKKTQLGATINLNNPEKKSLNETVEGVVDWSKADDLELITLQNNPKPGLWEISSDKDLTKFDIFIFADSAYKLSDLSIKGKKEAYETLTFQVNMLEKTSGKEDYKIVKVPNIKYFLEIIDPDGNKTVLPMLYSRMKQNFSYYVPNKEGLYAFSAQTKGDVERITPLKTLMISKPNLEEPKIMLDQSLYIIGETVKITVLNKNKDFKIPESPIKFYSSDRSILKEPKINRKDNKVYASSIINKQYEPGVYNVTYDYYDNGELKSKNAYAYVLGRVYIATDSLKFGPFSNDGVVESPFNINSELDETSIPLYLEISEININLDNIKPSDIRFNYSYEFFIKSAKKSIDLKMILLDKIFSKVQDLFLPKKLEGTITFKLYSKQKELLSEKIVPFSATILSKIQYNLLNILLVIGFLGVIGGAIFFFLKHKKTSSKEV